MPESDEMEKIYADLLPALSSNLKHGATIAIYGTGYAAARINKILAAYYAIAGYLDRDPDRVGEKLHGKTILSPEAITDIAAIVIASKPAFWEAIRQRISDLASQRNIRIFYANGREAEPAAQDGDPANPYWAESLDRLKEKCAGPDLISFDVFDTLLMRRLADKTDLFKIMARNLPAGFPAGQNFSLLREQAETFCQKKTNGIYALDDIYDELGQRASLDMGAKQALRELELATELAFLTPRPSVTALFQDLVRQGKRVLIISDTYFTEADMNRLLAAFGIFGQERLLLSCQEGVAKESGGMWDMVRSEYPAKTLLHIGDDSKADLEGPGRIQADSAYVMKSSDMLLASTLSPLAGHGQGLGDSLAMGLLETGLFADPFALHASEGRPLIDDPKQYGYVFFGPLVVCFMDWFIGQLRENPVELVLFGARDGYFFHKLYESMRKSLAFADLPPGAYLKTSRRALSVAAFFDEEAVMRSLSLTYTGFSDAFFRNRLGIAPPMPNQPINSSDPDILAMTERNMSVILANAAQERLRYLRYLNKLTQGQDRIALFDSGQNGTIQYHLQKLLQRPVNGHYIFYADKSGPFSPDLAATALYLESRDQGFHVLSQNTAVLESVFTEKGGTYLHIGPDKRFVQDATAANHDHFPVISRIHDGIKTYFNDYDELAGERGLGAPGKAFPAALLARLPQVGLSAGIKAACRYEDAFRTSAGRFGVFD